MKAMLLMGAMILTSIAANAGSTAFQCTTDTGKNVEIEYTSGSRRADKVLIDGATFTNASEVIVTRGGEVMVYVGNFRGSETLALVIANPSYYKLGSGRERPMDCKMVSSGGSSSRNDGI